MIGTTLRQRLAAGDHLLMVNPNHVSSGLAARLPEVGADLIFIDCEHGTAGFDEAREKGGAARPGGGGALLRPRPPQPPLVPRYPNVGGGGCSGPPSHPPRQARAPVGPGRPRLSPR